MPDQREPVQIAARITDSTGLIYFTEPVRGLKLERPGFSVELCKPYDVPQAFTSCQYGVRINRGPRSEKFKVSGEPPRIVAARFALSCWNAPSSSGLSVNAIPLEEKRRNGAGSHFFISLPLRPVTALKKGENIRSTIPGPARQSDIHWPGVMRFWPVRRKPARRAIDEVR